MSANVFNGDTFFWFTKILGFKHIIQFVYKVLILKRQHIFG